MSNRFKIASLHSPDLTISGTQSPDGGVYSALFDDFQLGQAAPGDQRVTQRAVGFTLHLQGQPGLKHLRLHIRGAGVAGGGQLGVLLLRDQDVRRWSRRVHQPNFTLPLRLSTRTDAMSFVLLMTHRWTLDADRDTGLLQIDSFDFERMGA